MTVKRMIKTVIDALLCCILVINNNLTVNAAGTDKLLSDL